MKIVYMGTPDFAVPTLIALANSERDEIVGIFTQPDRPKGRGHRMMMPPVKEKALDYGIPVFQPEKKIDEAEIRILKELDPDLIVVAAYGHILPETVIQLPLYGCINVHASLLPKYRGAAPIQWAIINGEKETGVTTMQMDAGLDTGDMLLRASIPIEDTDTSVTMHDKLAALGAELMMKTLETLREGKLKAEPQNSDASTYAPMLQRDTGEINWNQSASTIHCLIRGTQPWPAAYSFCQGEKMKIWQSKVIKMSSNSQCPGLIRQVSKHGILVDTAEDQLLIEEIQMPGKKRMAVSSFLTGNTISANITLGT
ncbi:methionyl-tRNA formyltransferase [Tindallia californiensis]|uniref:Methionyl-tRNA formyltransferase n=1 Tax=Tindallia californiensis TaxID=159292 RepID=A0A1H3NV15_9FIRM|nr:methionyl-tRNA formyltransferase [Tindallia californiensis]SDY92664.1 methionyl-tRNA formyltransferase [Tindallia californiensis]